MELAWIILIAAAATIAAWLAPSPARYVSPDRIMKKVIAKQGGEK